MSQNYEDTQLQNQHFTFAQNKQLQLQQPDTHQMYFSEEHNDNQFQQTKLKSSCINTKMNNQIVKNTQKRQGNSNSTIDLQQSSLNQPKNTVEDSSEQVINSVDHFAHSLSEESKEQATTLQKDNQKIYIQDTKAIREQSTVFSNEQQVKKEVIVIEDDSEHLSVLENSLQSKQHTTYSKNFVEEESQQISINSESEPDNTSIKCQKLDSQKQLNLKIKKVKKPKVDKLKQVDYALVPAKKQVMLKEKKKQKIEKTKYILMTKPVQLNYQFFLFCDIVIQHDNIVGKKIVQSKRSQLNLYKKISYIKEYKNSNLYEVGLQHTCQTQMEFQAASQFLLSLNDQYAKQVHDSLQLLQEKTRMGLETALMIQNNRASFELIMKRKEYSKMKYEEFKLKTLPNYKYYIFNHYVFDIYTGNIGFVDNGISKDFLKILCIEPQYFEVMMKKHGIIDFLKRDYVTAFSISYFNRFAYNMRNFTQTVRFSSDFITLDNIEIKVDIEHQIVDLCKEFDQNNNFDCPFIDFIAFLTPQISEEIVQNLQKVREEQQIDIDELLDMDEEEIDFFYNFQSQQFLKRYYSDIFSRDILTHNLKNQKLDYTLPNIKN
ncbi:hypothetical protein ABPG74_003519 [Tetrahymena malaccensis]